MGAALEVEMVIVANEGLGQSHWGEKGVVVGTKGGVRVPRDGLAEAKSRAAALRLEVLNYPSRMSPGLVGVSV